MVQRYRAVDIASSAENTPTALQSGHYRVGDQEGNLGRVHREQARQSVDCHV